MESTTKSLTSSVKDEESMSVKCTNHSLQNVEQYKSCTICYSRPQKALKPWNTFRLEVYATRISVVETIDALRQCWIESYSQGQPTLLLGEGSNVLFIENFCGHVIINRIKGFQIDEQAGSWVLHVGAGEFWHHLVKYTLQNGMPGLENLTLIPGCVGAAPIQNIGAYGVEFAKFCYYVDVFCLSDSKIRRLMAEECEFGYRDSIFKHSYREGYAIVAVGLRLPKTWQPELSYGNLGTLDPLTVTPQQVFDLVCVMRKEKLPDTNEIGNAGSFFKNPVVSAATATGLKIKFPLMPQYHQESGEVKLAAGWLIDQCDLKGLRIGDAAVHDKQALVLTNASAATSSHVIDLARKVRQRVADKFDIWLEPEVRFIGSHGEADAINVISIGNNDNTNSVTTMKINNYRSSNEDSC